VGHQGVARNAAVEKLGAKIAPSVQGREIKLKVAHAAVSLTIGGVPLDVEKREAGVDHSSAGDRACSSRSFHARPASSNSDLAKVDAPSCWALQLIVDSTGLKLNGPGEWLVEKHGTTKRRSWHKLHIGLDAWVMALMIAPMSMRLSRNDIRMPL
jgi:hypothetical protein